MLVCYSGFLCADVQTDRKIQEQSRLLYEYQRQLNVLQNEVDQLRGQVQQTQYQLKQVITAQQSMQQAAQPLTPQSVQTPAESAPVTTFTGDEKQDYDHLVQFILDGKESPALIAEFKAFNEQYPHSKYQANVYFWIGQLSYKFDQLDEASLYFAKVVKEYPDSAKAGLSLAKIGQILEKKGETQKAKAVYEQVLTQYANRTDAVSLAQTQLEQLK